MASVTNRRLHLLLVILWFGTLSCATLLGETPVPLATIAPTVAPATPTLGAISVITTPTSTTEPITMPTRRPTPTDTPTPEPLIPGAIACPAGGNNLLVNPSFEGNFRAQGNDAIIVADGWIAWWLRGSATSQQPDYQQATSGNRVHSGGSAQQLYKRQAQYQGGVYQIVENAQITAGTHVQFSIWGQGFSCAEGADCNQGLSVDPANMFMRVGIDPPAILIPMPELSGGLVILTQ